MCVRFIIPYLFQISKVQIIVHGLGKYLVLVDVEFYVMILCSAVHDRYNRRHHNKPLVPIELERTFADFRCNPVTPYYLEAITSTL